MTELTTAGIRFQLLWSMLLGFSVPLHDDDPVEVTREARRLMAQGRAELVDGQLQALPHPSERRYTDAANAAVDAAMKIVLCDLEAAAPRDDAWWNRRLREYGIDDDHLAIAVNRLTADGLIRITEDGMTPAHPPARRPEPLTLDAIGVHRPAPPELEPEPLSPPPPTAPPPASMPAPLPPVPTSPPASAPTSPPAPAPTPAPTPAPAPHASVPTSPPASRALKHTPAPAPAATPMRAPEPTSVVEVAELVRRAAEGIEALVEHSGAPRRAVQTRSGEAPLLDVMRRVAVAITAEGGPTTSTTLVTRYLTKAQRTFLPAALAEGARRGVFTRTGGLTRGARYALADPAPMGGTWEAVNAAAAAVLERRRQRQAS